LQANIITDDMVDENWRALDLKNSSLMGYFYLLHGLQCFYVVYVRVSSHFVPCYESAVPL
jgi:hypothetical protein